MVLAIVLYDLKFIKNLNFTIVLYKIFSKIYLKSKIRINSNTVYKTNSEKFVADKWKKNVLFIAIISWK